MPLTFTPAPTTPEGHPVKPATYQPERTSPGAYGNTSPIPGMEQPQQQAPPGTAQEYGAAAEPGKQEGDDIAWRLSVVARQSRAARERLEAAKAAESQARALGDQVTAREQAVKVEEAKRVLWRQNPSALLRDFGYNVEAALQYMLNGEKMTPEQQLAASVDIRFDQERQANEQRLEALRQEQAQQNAERQAQDAKAEQRALSEQEQIAVRELQADIGDIVAGDPKAFPLLRKAQGQRGIDAVYDRVQTLSDEMYKTSGRRPPLTTKLLEQAAHEVEQAARKELNDVMADPEIAAQVGLLPQRVPRPQTLTNRAPPMAQEQRGAPAQETRAEKEARFKAALQRVLDARRGG